jgi:membrane fusion protein (multidrug efflux system)
VTDVVSAPAPTSPPRGPRRLARPAGALVLVLLAFAFGYWPRHHAQTKLAQETRAQAREAPRVAVITAQAEDSGRSLVLPGNLVAMQDTLVYARANGYVRRWRVDIGDRVHDGDVLAELDTPEIDQQLKQSRATLQQQRAALAQAQANLAFALVTANRYQPLFEAGVVPKQLADQANAQAKIWQANVNAAEANIVAQAANVGQYAELVSYGRVLAPFDGTISERRIDVGSLVNAGSGANGQPLFRLVAIDPMRVFVQVPQTYAPGVHVGDAATVAVRQYPGRDFAGKVTRSAGALDPTSRTLNTEIQVPNRSGDLFPGMYAEVTMTGTVSHPVVRVPSSAVIADSQGVHVAVVDPSSRVHLTTVQPGRDFGSVIELVGGLSGGEQVVVSPLASVTDGMPVQVTAHPSSPDGG